MNINDFKFDAPPPPVGHYILNGESRPSVTWYWSVRPAWWHRICSRLFFGWKWVDVPPVFTSEKP